MYHCLLIHSPVRGHLGCFSFDAVMNKTTINVHGERFLGEYNFLFLWGVSLAVRLLCFITNVHLTLDEELPNCFLKCLYPQAVYKNSIYFHFSPALGIVSVFLFGWLFFFVFFCFLAILYTYIHTYIHMYIHLYVYIYMYTYTYIHTQW